MNANEHRNFHIQFLPACAFQDTSETYSTSQIVPPNFAVEQAPISKSPLTLKSDAFKYRSHPGQRCLRAQQTTYPTLCTSLS